MKYYSVILIHVLAALILAQSLPEVQPESVGMDKDVLAKIDTVINLAIADGQTPGAVLLVSRAGAVVYRKAYGYQMTVPEKKKMTVETVFDLASITKPMATATSVMILIQRGQLRLMDAVSDFIPGFKPWKDPESDETRTIRIWHLLTHTSGLPPYAPVQELEEEYGAPNPDSLIQYIAQVERHSPPESKFKYSCLNFITLQKVIETISGEIPGGFLLLLFLLVSINLALFYFYKHSGLITLRQMRQKSIKYTFGLIFIYAVIWNFLQPPRLPDSVLVVPFQKNIKQVSAAVPEGVELALYRNIHSDYRVHHWEWFWETLAKDSALDFNYRLQVAQRLNIQHIISGKIDGNSAVVQYISTTGVAQETSPSSHRHREANGKQSAD